MPVYEDCKKTSRPFNGLDQRLLFQMLWYVDFERINWVPHFTDAEHGVDYSQNHSDNGNNSPLGT